MKRALFFLFSFLLFSHIAYAEWVVGRVVDAQTKEPLEGASISISIAVRTQEDNLTLNLGAITNEKGIFHFRSDWPKTEMTVSYLGYYENRLRVNCAEGTDTLRLKDIELEPTEFMLKTLLVTGHAKRFTIRGDTVVFNPEGFHLEAGDRLEQLIEKLPGVTNDNGKLSWNGKPIRLRMNGNDAFSEGMLGQLPVESVQEIKAYDKKSQLEERTGQDDGEEDQVLDITIKKSFLDKWYGSLGLQAYSSPNYAAQVVGNYLSEHSPMMAYGRLGDNNSQLEPYSFRGLIGNMGAYYRQQLGAWGYQHNWKSKFDEARENNRWDVNTYLNHQDTREYKNTTLETFLKDMEPTLQQGSQADYIHEVKAPISFSSFFNVSNNTYLELMADARYAKKRVSSTNEQETNLLEALGGQNLVNKSHSLQQKDQNEKYVHGEARFIHLFGKNQVNNRAYLNYKETHADTHEQTNYDFFQADTRHETDIQDFTTQNKELNFVYLSSIYLNLSKQLRLVGSYGLEYMKKTKVDDRFRNGTADLANTLDMSHNQLVNEFDLELRWNVKKFVITPKASVRFQHEKMDYQRGSLDTLATRNSVLPEAHFDVQFKPNRNHNLSFSNSYETVVPDLLNTLAMRDDTNPLLVVEGNTNLKQSKVLSSSLKYSYLQPKHDQSLSITLSYKKNMDPVQIVSYYNPETGAYRMHQENTKGGNSWLLYTTYSRALNDDWQWDNTLSGGLNDSYGVLTLIEGNNQRTLAQQNYTNLSYSPSLEYNKKKLKLVFSPSGNWSHYTYKGDEVSGYDLYSYSFATQIQYSLGKVKLALNPTFKGRKGYNNAKFNRDYLVLEGKVTYEPKKNRILTLEMNDLLNKDMRYLNSETSTTRSETLLTNFHHYVSLNFTYRFDAKDKEKKD